MAKLGSSQSPAASPGAGRRLGGATSGGEAAQEPDHLASAPAAIAGTTAERLAAATLAGALRAVPAAYENGQDWETLLSDDVFARLYLAAPLHAQITDAQVVANHAVLAEFWEPKFNNLLTGDRDVEKRYGAGTVNRAAERLDAARAALADAEGRSKCFDELEKRRLQAATEQTAPYLARVLVLMENVMKPHSIQDVLKEGLRAGFTLPEAEAYLLGAMRQAGLDPVRTIKPVANTLLATWTVGGQAPIGLLRTRVLGQDVYNLPEAGQLLYDAFVSGNEKALLNLDDDEYLVDIANGLGELDVKRELKALLGLQLGKDRKRLTALYLLNPGLPYTPADSAVPAFDSAEQLLTRSARSAADFAAAEAAFKAGLLQIWLRASAAGAIKTALPANGSPANCTALAFRQFLHRAAPAFPLWIGRESFAGPTELAAYIRRDENTWKMVYGSLNAGNLVPWLQALGQSNILERQSKLADAFAGQESGTMRTGREMSVAEIRSMLAVQALLEALDPTTAVPSLAANLGEVDLTGLSGETPGERTLSFTNTTGGMVRVFLEVMPLMEGVRLSSAGLFFDQRAPGQQLNVTLTGNPSLMPRDGQHTAQLQVRTAYAVATVPVRASAVFPTQLFWKFVIGAGLALAAVFAGVRLLLGQLLGNGKYDGMVAQGNLLPLDQAVQAGRTSGFTLVAVLLLFGGLLYGFVRVMVRLAKPQPTA